MEHAAFDCTPQSFGIDDEPAIMSDDDAFYPNVPGSPIDFHFRDRGNHRLSAKCVCDAAACQDVARTAPFRRWTCIPAELFGGGFHHSDRARALEAAVVGRCCGEQLQPKL